MDRHPGSLGKTEQEAEENDLQGRPGRLVQGRGQFASRGGILDVFPWQEPSPLRIEFFDTDIESIRSFDVDAQTSIQKLDTARLLLEEPEADGRVADYRPMTTAYLACTVADGDRAESGTYNLAARADLGFYTADRQERLVDRAVAGLTDAGVPCAWYDGVEPDPTYRELEEGLAVGGGVGPTTGE